MKTAATRTAFATCMFAQLLIVLVITSSAIFAQDTPAAGAGAPKIEEPEYANSFFLLDSSGALKPLERQSASVRGKIKAFGFGGAETSYQVQGDHSPVRVPAGTPLAIVVKLENHDLDPATQVALYPLKVDKGARELQIARSHFMGATKIDVQGQQITLEFAKYGQSSVKVTSSSPLPAGEYAMAVQNQTGMPLAYCFGVDAAAK